MARRHRRVGQGEGLLRRAVTAALTFALAATLAAAKLPPPMPGPAAGKRAFPSSPARENAACEGCHSEIAREWRDSLHRQAHTDPRYREALALEPLSFCEGCHAPEADAQRPVTAEASRVGVACMSCHRVEGEGGAVLAAPAPPGKQAAPAPHAVVRDARFAQRDACAGCHEFAFEDGRPWRELMQSTATEHAASPLRGTPCADCHMPRGGADRHRTHRVDVSEAMLKSALRVRATRTGPTTLSIRLEPLAVGHAMPTGDLFRRLAVEARPTAGDARSATRRYLARHFRRSVAGAAGHRTLARDDRPGAKGGSPVEVVLELGPEAKGKPVAWEVRYERVSHPISERDSDSVVASTVRLAEGTAPPR